MSDKIIPLFSIKTIALSARYKTTHSATMQLLSDASEYLDRRGAADVKALTPAATISYAQMSVRLTFQLTHLASWAFIQRSAIDGELSADEAAANSVQCLKTLTAPLTDDPSLPDAFRELVRRSVSCQREIVALHNSMYDAQRAA